VSTRLRAVAALLVLLAVAAALVAPPAPSACAAAEPVITVTPVIKATLPRQVPTAASGETVKVVVVVSSSEPVAGATAFGGGSGLAVTNPNQPLGNLAQPVTVSFDVAGAEPGVHGMFVTVLTSGDATGVVLIKYVWTSGSPLPAQTSKRDQRSFGWEGTEQVAGLESSTRAVRMLSIVGPKYAFVGLPAHGLPKCTQPVGGCVPYSYDSQTNLLQVGTGIIAAPHVSGLYTDGLVPADEQNGELYGRYDFPLGFSPPTRRSVLTGTFSYSSRDYPTGITFERVTFREDRTYKLAYAVDGGKVRKLSGTFRLGKRGSITFRSATKVKQRGTVLLGKRVHGVPQSRLGLWLILSGPKGKHPDGNLLQQVGRPK
jgi:hypothetical protein